MNCYHLEKRNKYSSQENEQAVLKITAICSSLRKEAIEAVKKAKASRKRKSVVACLDLVHQNGSQRNSGHSLEESNF